MKIKNHKTKRKIVAKILGYSFAIFLLAFMEVGVPICTYALKKVDYQRYAENNIWFYDGDEIDCYGLNNGMGAFNGLIYDGTLSELQAEFMDKYADWAMEFSIQYGVPWEVAIAQGILESASGTSPQAINKYNFHGIGAFDSDPSQAKTFASPREGWEGYFKNLKVTNTYKMHGVFRDAAITDPYAALVRISAAGYSSKGSAYAVSVSAVLAGVMNRIAADPRYKTTAELAVEHPEIFENARRNAEGGADYDDSLWGGTTGGSSGNGKIDGSKITIIGDSITAWFGNSLHADTREAHPWYNETNIVAEPGASFKTYGIDQLQALASSGQLRDILIYEFGTNDGIQPIQQQIGRSNPVKDEDIQKVLDIAGNRTVIFITNYVNDENSGGENTYPVNNEAFFKAAREHSNVRVADWLSIVKGRDGELLGDGVHPNHAGYIEWIEMLEDVLRGVSSGECQNANNRFGLVSGGMTLEEAKAFMLAYRQRASLTEKQIEQFEIGGMPMAFVHDAGCRDGTLNNCVAFSQWFVNAYAIPNNQLRDTTNGKDYAVHLIASRNFIDGGNVPRAYAVMSKPGPTDAGHTGIVLGIDMERGKIIIGEASCNGGWNDDFPGANEYDLSIYTAATIRYAYAPSLMSLGVAL